MIFKFFFLIIELTLAHFSKYIVWLTFAGNVSRVSKVVILCGNQIS